jgi:hypothetical protein
MGYSWFRVDGGFSQHPKTLALCDALKEPLADAYVVRLWSWVHCYAPTGHVLSRVTGALEAALRWQGAPGLLITTMTEVGFLDPVSDGLLVHDWADYQAVFAEKAKRNAALKRQKRKRRHASVTRDVTHLSRVTAPPTDETRRDETRRDIFSAPPAKKPREPKPVDPRFAPLIGRLRADFLELAGSNYDFSDADGNALRNLLKRADDAEIERRWRIGLSADTYSPKCATLLQLAQRWNELAVQRGTKPAKAPETVYIDSWHDGSKQ